MKQNLKRAAVYGVAGLATAAIGASAANAIADDGQENHDAKPAQAAAQAVPVPQHAAPPPAAAAPQGEVARPQHTVDGPAKPHHVTPPAKPHHVVPPAAAHRPAVAAARRVLPKQPPAKHAKSSPRTRSSAVQKKVDASATRYVVRAAVQAAAPVVEKQESSRIVSGTTQQGLDEAVKAVGVAHQAVRDAEKTFDEAGKALAEAQDTLGKTRSDLEKVRDGLKTKKGPCDDERAKRTHHKHDKVVSKTASVSSGGVSSTSTATSTNGTVSATAW